MARVDQQFAGFGHQARRQGEGHGLRGKAFQPNTDLKAKPASAYAAACVELLSAAGAAQRGRIVDVLA